MPLTSATNPDKVGPTQPMANEASHAVEVIRRASMDVVEGKDGMRGHWQTGSGPKAGMLLAMRIRHVPRASAESTHHCYRTSSLRCTADNPPSAFEHCGCVLVSCHVAG